MVGETGQREKGTKLRFLILRCVAWAVSTVSCVGEALARFAVDLAGSLDRRREKLYISLDRFKEASRIKASLEL
jgi:hypothetical protein